MIINNDCLEAMQKLIDDGVQVDSVVTDPPYHLQSIVDRYGKENSAPAQHGTDGVFVRASTGFMGKEWDGGDIAFRKETWELTLKLLKPGGYLLAFSAPRNYHRMAVAIEDAGFEIRDQIMWLYGSGFPKSYNLGDGWGTALKPAHEPIVMARKSIEETNKNNREKYGTGGINIDGCRVKGKDNPVKWTKPRGGIWRTDPDAKAELIENEKGRYPANVMHDGLEEEWSRYFYCPKANQSEKGENNTHPTVKPQELMKYLCRLVTPENGIVLDPFMGSGSTGMAAKDEGFKFIGIEKEEEYFEIAEKRIKSASPLMEFI